jgi:hypothetical protein
MSTLNKKATTYLSKSLFIKGLQCHKSLYLHKYHPELKDETTEMQEATFQSGRAVGIYAQKLFPNGVEITYDDLSLSDQLDRTAKELERGTETIYEPAFKYDDIFVKVDILHKGEQGWEIYEVKQSTNVKEYNFHYEDVAIQYYVLKGFGLHVSKAFLVHINAAYVRHGEIEVDKLFTKKDLTDTIVEKQEFVEDGIRKMRDILKGEEPDIDIGKYCSKPYVCDFHGHCWQHIPEDSIFSLRDKGPDQFELYRKGIIRLEDVPVEILPRNQKIQLEGTLYKKNITNKEGVKEFLDTLWYPIYFLDFETIFMAPIPMFDGVSPYQQVPFQYSLHYQKRERTEIRHYEYLAPAHSDPRRELIEKLLGEIPGNACVVAYNKSFEARILNCLKGWFPEYADQINSIIANLRDLMIPFRRKYVYHWEMAGSFSLKGVLPALVPELGYDGLEISDGGMASMAYLRLWETKDPVETERIRTALLEYCKLDTLSTVRILEKLREM